MDDRKKARIEKIILETINDLIIKDKFSNPNIDNTVFAVFVKVSPDVGYADVYLNQYQINKLDIKKIVLEFEKSKGFIQRQIANKLKTRLTPRLRFHEDISLDIAYRVSDFFDSEKNNEKNNEL